MPLFGANQGGNYVEQLGYGALASGLRPRPVYNPLSGISRFLTPILGGYLVSQGRRQDAERQALIASELRAIAGKTSGAPNPQQAFFEAAISSASPEVRNWGAEQYAGYLGTAAKPQRLIPLDLGGRRVLANPITGDEVREYEATLSPATAGQIASREEQRRLDREQQERLTGVRISAAASRAAAGRAAAMSRAQVMAGGLAASAGGGPAEQYAKSLLSGMGKAESRDFTDVIQPAARAGATALHEVDKVEDAIKNGAYQGPGAGVREQAARLVKAFTGPGAFDRASATEALGQALDLMGLSQVKPMVGSQNVSNIDLKAVMSAMGTINTDPTALQKVLERTRQISRRAIDLNNKKVEKFNKMGVPSDEYRVEPITYTPMGRQLSPAEKAEKEALERAILPRGP